MSTPLLSVRELCTTYRLPGTPRKSLQAVRNASLDIPEGGIVGLVGEPGSEQIIAEGRYVKQDGGLYADTAFVVDEKYQGLGMAQYLYSMLIRLAKERGLKGFTAEVLQDNKGMIQVFEKGGLPVEALLKDGVYNLRIPFSSDEP